MNPRQASQTGLAIYAAISLLVVGGSVFVATRRWAPAGGAPVGAAPLSRSGVAPPAEAPAAPLLMTEENPAPAAVRPSETPAALVARLAALVARDPTEGDVEELVRIQDELVALGELAAPELVQRIDSLRGPRAAAHRERLFDVLRRLPGRTAEDRLIREARFGSPDSSRSLAIESLGDRRTKRAVDALARIAETDPDLPERTLITAPRDPSSSSTELPDEVVFTPRMQALAALASTSDARAAEVLSGVLHDGPDESLRMEAARYLEGFGATPGAVAALRGAAAADPSPYVRLAALHALASSSDRTLGPMLESIAARDGDAGVRALAQRVLASLLP